MSCSLCEYSTKAIITCIRAINCTEYIKLYHIKLKQHIFNYYCFFLLEYKLSDKLNKAV